jgi:hypothetical protein
MGNLCRRHGSFSTLFCSNCCLCTMCRRLALLENVAAATKPSEARTPLLERSTHEAPLQPPLQHQQRTCLLITGNAVGWEATPSYTCSNSPLLSSSPLCVFV